MKHICYIFIVLFCANPTFAQKYKLISTKYFSDYSKDCTETGNCISTKYLKNDTLHLTIHIVNINRNLNAFRNSISFNNDTLNINLNDTNKVVVTKVFNKSKNKMEAIEFQTYSLQTFNGEPDFQRIEYILTGFEDIPKAFKFDYSYLCDCPTKPIKFEICDNDTINMINENGHKHGTWVEFYNTGEIETKREYKNGQLIVGYCYDKQGKATFKLEKNSEMEIAEPIEKIK